MLAGEVLGVVSKFLAPGVEPGCVVWGVVKARADWAEVGSHKGGVGLR